MKTNDTIGLATMRLTYRGADASVHVARPGGKPDHRRIPRIGPPMCLRSHKVKSSSAEGPNSIRFPFEP